MYLWYLEKIWRKSANPNTHKSVRNEFVSARLGRVGQKCRLLAVGPTCRRHVADMSATFPAKMASDIAMLLDGDGNGRLDGSLTARDGAMATQKGDR